MKLKDIRKRCNECADYMVEQITYVIDNFGKRAPASEGEKKTIEYMAEQLKPICDEINVEAFDLHPDGFYGWIYFSVTLVIIGIIMYFWLPLLSLIFSTLSIIIMAGEFLFYRKMIDKLFKKKTSYNLTAVKKPSGEVKRRIFFNGHPDAAYEWSANYHFGGIVFILHAILSIAGIFATIILSIVSMALNQNIGFSPATGVMKALGIANLIFIPIIFCMYWMSSKRIIVDGANDNLTGCYMGISILKELNEHGINLENTEVGVIITGSEEAGLRGAKAWSKKHKGEYDDVETLIFTYDTIHDAKYLCANDFDCNMTVKANKRASNLFLNSAKSIDIPCHRGAIPLGATDSAAFNQEGFKAIGITALDHNLQNYYHTRKDTYDNLDKDCLAKCFAVSVKTLEDFDAGL